MPLTRDQILNTVDLSTKEIHIPEWDGTVFIRQLTRAEQDEYLRRQFGDAKIRQAGKQGSQEINLSNMYGHDAYVCACGICDSDGRSLFKVADVDALKKKNGDVIGRIALEIITFSGMAGDVFEEEEVKNS